MIHKSPRQFSKQTIVLQSLQKALTPSHLHSLSARPPHFQCILRRAEGYLSQYAYYEPLLGCLLAPVDGVDRYILRDARQKPCNADLDGALRAVAQHAANHNVSNILHHSLHSSERPKQRGV